ncbi:MAG TPA: lycopene cyclase domain-containing protein [Ktedonobacterales bacterium]
MTYAQVLAFGVVVPVIGLALLVARDRRRPDRGRPGREWTWAWRGQSRGWSVGVVIVALIVVAMVYTAPWDNHLIATHVWRYRRALISGIVVGEMPLEEVLFFPAQTLLVCLWLLWLAAREPPARDVSGRALGRDVASDGKRAIGHWVWPPMALALLLSASGCLWLIGLIALRAPWRSVTYLGWELVWVVPPLALQVVVGGDIIWRYRRLLCVTVLPVALYLCVIDALAIGEGIWTIDPAQTLGIRIAGVLPIEELIFFAATSTLVAFGLLLGVAGQARLMPFPRRPRGWPTKPSATKAS